MCDTPRWTSTTLVWSVSRIDYVEAYIRELCKVRHWSSSLPQKTIMKQEIRFYGDWIAEGQRGRAVQAHIARTSDPLYGLVTTLIENARQPTWYHPNRLGVYLTTIPPSNLPWTNPSRGLESVNLNILGKPWILSLQRVWGSDVRGRSSHFRGYVESALHSA
ncbi:hypothetical protein BDZ97DRAFT_1980618 [Flammula alnicola]|nr:hypothetical protein BDZ97DRAFT_1980618 [Flammula alnicola]